MTQAIIVSYPYASPTITVEIAADKVEQDFINKVGRHYQIVRKQNQDTSTSEALYYPLGQVEHHIMIHGYLLSDSTSTALEKKEALLSYTTLGAGHAEAPSSVGILHRKEDLKLSWRTETIQCRCDKCKIIDDAGRDQREGAPHKYELILTLTKGAVR